MAESIYQLAKELGEILKAKSLMLTAAESCTGGGFAQAITAVSGSSEWFERGFVTYSNAAKQQMLGVQANILEKYGAVSKQVAKEMAEGALKFSDAQISIAITGIAGPTGGTPEKPIGLVWFGFSKKNSLTQTISKNFAGDRAAIREQAVLFGLQGLLHIVST